MLVLLQAINMFFEGNSEGAKNTYRGSYLLATVAKNTTQTKQRKVSHDKQYVKVNSRVD